MKSKSVLNSTKILEPLFLDTHLDRIRLCCCNDDYLKKPKVAITINKLREFEILLANINLILDHEAHILGFVT